MANKSNMSLQKERKRVRMQTRMLLLVLLVAVLQLLTFIAVLNFGGEFRYLKESSYQTLSEKTENRSVYIRKELHEKSVIVQEYADRFDSAADGIMNENKASIADLKTDKELSYDIIVSSADIVASLLRSSAADDAYLILDTGELFTDENGDTAKVALYLTGAGSENGDIQLLIGSEALSRELGIALRSDRSEYFTTAPDDGAGFYSTAIQTAQENSSLSQNDLGHWSSFSAVSSETEPSMRYSLPLIAEDGTVYGIIGIGLTKSSVDSAMSLQNTKDDTVCYVLGYKDETDRYDILTGCGSSYSTLLGGADTLRVNSSESDGICDFDMVKGTELSGCVQDMEIYGGSSPYAEERWALISVAPKTDLLFSHLLLKRLLLISVILSFIAAVIIAVPGCKIIVKPLSKLSRQIKTKRKYNEVVRFQPSNIYEIDEITDAITHMHINVHNFSSQVSKMISIADVGLGTFMYDRTDDSVFVGQSLIKVLKLELPQGEDIVMSRREFLSSIKNPDVREPIAEGLEMSEGLMRKEFNNIYEIDRLSGGKLWMRLGYTYSSNSAIGIVQDITDSVMEKNRIEYERDYDHLTGLLNRHAYYRRIEKLFHDKSKLKITAFVMIDLDNLKYVNDTYGHNFGDDYIRTAATALKKFQDHGAITSRLSGDEFSICLSGFDSKEEVRGIINNVRDELLHGGCLLADGTHFKVSGSMGVAWYPDDAESRELLMRYADFAMYTIKHSTKGGIAEFDMDSYSKNSVLLTGIEEMNRIIESSAVKYAFQSIVSVKTGEIFGYEALMRVQSKIFRSPLELIRIAKSGAKLYEIERLTLTRSLADFQALTDKGLIANDAHIFINSIANNRLNPETEAEIAEKYKDIRHRIVLEILESESSDEECTMHKARLIREWGGQLALDDFGTGYNSEYALLNFRPNIIKIDRSIINGCDNDSYRRMIIENLVKLSHAKSILVLAEGVETKKEMETVISCGVDLMQGYYLAKPLFEPEPIAPQLAETIRNLAEQRNKK